MYVIVKKGAGKAPDLQLVTGVSFKNAFPPYSQEAEDSMAAACVESRSIMKVPEFIIEALDGLRFEHTEQAMALLVVLSLMGEEIMDYQICSVDL